MKYVNKLTLKSALLPDSLSQMSDPPKQLYYRGDLTDFSIAPRLAVVGSRKATPYGIAVTKKLVSDVASHGVIIVSGLALGIDSIAHRAALEVGGKTVAVLACGVERFYPATHAQLGEQMIASGGAVISEYPEGTEPLAHQFVARNRIIAGLSNAVLITEAAERSGSLHTANFGLEQGKSIMVVPGSILSPMSTGANNLLKAGAIPVTNTEDILAVLGVNPSSKPSLEAANEQEAVLLKLLTEGIQDSDELQHASKLEPALFNQTLTMLEITGKIKALGAGRWTIA